MSPISLSSVAYLKIILSDGIYSGIYLTYLIIVQNNRHDPLSGMWNVSISNFGFRLWFWGK